MNNLEENKVCVIKPLEFKIIETEKGFEMVFFFNDGQKCSFILGKCMPQGLIIDRHYHIDDMYGYSVIDDRKGL